MDSNLVVDLLSNGVLGKDLSPVNNPFSDVKLIGIYFSAHWCPPCRNFTPVLRNVYNEVNKNGKQMEIVFASSDRELNQFQEYFNEMPWLTLPFEDPRIETLSDMYGCEGIPHLVVIKPDGTLVSQKARKQVGSHGATAFNLWLEKSNAGPFNPIETLSKNVVGKDLKEVENATKSSKLIGLYFSAHWCPPCKAFTPVLANFYNKVNANEKQIEIIFVSCDRDANQFKDYYNEMPWLTLPFGDTRCETLSEEYECQGIPYFVILNSDGSLVTKTGRDDVKNIGEAAIQKWFGYK